MRQSSVHLIRKVRFLVSPLLLATFLITPTLLLQTKAIAESAYCVVISINNNAWVTRKDASVKSTLKIGDQLYPGDRLEVFQGSGVDLAFDKESYNVLHVKGETYLELTALTPTDITIEDKKGHVFALLDRLDRRQKFSIKTPTAVAAVRGTQFHINYARGQTNVMTYEGSVRVYGRDNAGNATLDYVNVLAGTKTAVIGKGRLPHDPVAMTGMEMRKIDEVRTNAEELRQWLQDSGFSKGLDRSKRDTRSKSGIIKDEDESGSDKSKKDGVLLF